MSNAINRRIERFQTKLQQRLNLADDEIARLNAYYSSVLAEITSATDQLERYRRIGQQNIQKIDGDSKKDIAQRNADIALINSQHAKVLINLQEQHSQQIMQLQREFEETLKSVDKWAESCVFQKTQSINQQLDRTQAAIDRTKQTLTLSTNSIQRDETNSLGPQLDYEVDRIRRLEDKLKEMNQDRLDTLLSLKSRLLDSMTVLEDVDQGHANRMKDYGQKLEEIDRKYDETLKEEAEKHEKEMFTYTNQLNGLKRKVNNYQNQIEKSTNRTRERIATIEQANEEIKSSIRIVSTNTVNSTVNESVDINGATKSLQHTQYSLAQKNNELLQARTENESLKREIARLRHEALIKERRERQ